MTTWDDALFWSGIVGAICCFVAVSPRFRGSGWRRLSRVVWPVWLWPLLLFTSDALTATDGQQLLLLEALVTVIGLALLVYRLTAGRSRIVHAPASERPLARLSAAAKLTTGFGGMLAIWTLTHITSGFTGMCSDSRLPGSEELLFVGSCLQVLVWAGGMISLIPLFCAPSPDAPAMSAE